MDTYTIVAFASIIILAFIGIIGILVILKLDHHKVAISEVPVGRRGLSPYSCRLDKDPVAERLADNAFKKSSYCFWNDINHYGGSKNLYYSSPEVLLHDLYTKIPAESKETYHDREDYELLSVLDWYTFMAWYYNDEEVYGIYIDQVYEFDFVNDIVYGDKFLGFSWLSRKDYTPDSSRPELVYDWKSIANKNLETEADIFEKSVRKFVSDKHNAES